MPLHWIDWTILLVPLLVTCWIGVATQKHMRSVSDFMTAGRGAGRYLVCTAELMAGIGLISVVANCEVTYKAGFAFEWWRSLLVATSMFITLTGFVIYRYRETRVLTLAQFFEVRYSRAFRIFAGILISLSGILNYAIFPAVAGRFIVYYCGLPQHIPILGIEFPTFGLCMLVTLSVAVFFVLLGGQLTNMVIDCVQGLFSYAMYVIIAIALLCIFSWEQISASMTDVPQGESLLNPFDTGQVKDFNLWYMLIAVLGAVYGTRAWQGGHAFNASAATPHEAKMGGILGSWRALSLNVMMVLLAVCAYTYLHHPDFATGAASVSNLVSGIDNPQIREQMRVPLALSHVLPVGIKGVFLAVMVFLLITTDVSYLHSWGSIVIQDVVLPFRKKPFTPRQHLRLLRLSIVAVAAFAFFFSLWFRQTQYVILYFALTGTIYLGGAGSVIIGGLYWKKGTTAAAWAAMSIGGLLGVGGVILEQSWQGSLAPWLIRHFPASQYLAAHADRFPINGQVMWFIAMVSAITAYIIISLLTCKREFNMNRMLHRGPYAVEQYAREAPLSAEPSIWQKLIGIDENFTRGDRILSYCVFGWGMFWLSVFFAVTAINLVHPWPTSWWAQYWRIVGILMPLALGTVTSVWFTIGGIRDLRRLFRHLRTIRRDVLDDGRVVEGLAAGEPPAGARSDAAIDRGTANELERTTHRR